MKIGIASPVLIRPLLQRFPGIDAAEFPGGQGGPVINSLIEGLLRLGHRVSVYTLDEGVTVPLILKGNPLSLYIGPYRKSAKKRALSLFSREAAWVASFIEQDGPDIVNAHWSAEYGRAAAACAMPHLISLRDHCRTILTLQRDYYRVFRYLTDVKVRRQGRWFSVNSVHLQRLFSPWQKDLPILPDSIDERYIATAFRPFPRHEVRMVSLISGWGPVKNVTAALRAFALIRARLARPVTYTLFGTGCGPGGPASSWAVSNGLARGVIFKGPEEHATLMGLLPSYDLLLHPSLEESFGDPLMEGMAAGIPVAGGWASGAVPWVLDHGHHGLLTDISSPETMADHIVALLRSRERWEFLSRTGPSYVRKRFASLSVASSYLSCYRQILARHKGGRP